MWFADDAIASRRKYLGSKMVGSYRYLVERGPAYGYHPNPAKTCLVVKKEQIKMAKKVFRETGISVTEEGKFHPGAAIGTQAFVENC